MLAVLPDMLNWAKALRHNQGQLDLFTAAIAEPPVEQDLLEGNAQVSTHTMQSPRLRYLRRLWEEANIGVAFTRSEEMDSLIGALEKSGGLRSRLITTAQIGANHLGESVYLVGLLGSIRMIESSDTSGKEPLAVGLLEDAEGSIELVAFPPNYKRHAELWTESNMVIVTGRVSRHDDGEIYLLSEHLAAFQGSAGHEAMTLNVKATKPSRSANRADRSPTATDAPTLREPANPAPQPVAAARGPLQALPRLSAQPPPTSGEPATFSLVITIPSADDDHTVIDSMIALNSLLNSHPGPDSVTLRVQYSPESGKWTSARLPMGVRYSHALESAIRRLLGDDALAVIKLVA